MRVDLDIEDRSLEGLPRFQRSAYQSRRLKLLAWLAGGLAALLFLAAIFIGLFTADSLWLPLLCNNAAALLLLAAVSQSAWRVAHWRAAAIGTTESAPAPEAPVDLAQLSAYDRLLERIS